MFANPWFTIIIILNVIGLAYALYMDGATPPAKQVNFWHSFWGVAVNIMLIILAMNWAVTHA